MQITEVEVKHTPDTAPRPSGSDSSRRKLSWRAWKEFPRWDVMTLVIDEKQDQEKILAKLKDNLVCHGTWFGKHHITYWKHYNTADDYAKDHGE